MRPSERRRREAGWVKPVSAALHPTRREVSLGKTVGAGGLKESRVLLVEGRKQER